MFPWLAVLVLHAKEVHVVQVGDVHGWLYGHWDDSRLGDLGDLLSYYQNVEKNISANPDAAVILVNGGDICDGTGLSNVPSPQCSVVANFISRVPFDLATVGEHDLASEEGSAYIY